MLTCGKNASTLACDRASYVLCSPHKSIWTDAEIVLSFLELISCWVKISHHG